MTYRLATISGPARPVGAPDGRHDGTATVLSVRDRHPLAVVRSSRPTTGAAELTGAPSDLASALEALSDDRSRPSEDKHTWAKSASALDILPREAAVASPGPFRTHPSTEQRIERLEQLVVERVRVPPAASSGSAFPGRRRRAACPPNKGCSAEGR